MTCLPPFELVLFFFNATATTENYTLSLHDALPIFVENFKKQEADKAAADLANLVAEMQRRETNRLLGDQIKFLKDNLQADGMA